MGGKKENKTTVRVMVRKRSGRREVNECSMSAGQFSL